MCQDQIDGGIAFGHVLEQCHPPGMPEDRDSKFGYRIKYLGSRCDVQLQPAQAHLAAFLQQHLPYAPLFAHSVMLGESNELRMPFDDFGDLTVSLLKGVVRNGKNACSVYSCLTVAANDFCRIRNGAPGSRERSGC